MATKDGKKTGGRKAGTLNKRTATITDMLNKKGANPIEVLSDAMLKYVKEHDIDKAVAVADKLAPYHSPRLAASKIEGELVGMTYEQKLALLDKGEE